MLLTMHLQHRTVSSDGQRSLGLITSQGHLLFERALRIIKAGYKYTDRVSGVKFEVDNSDHTIMCYAISGAEP